jgi:hypothetical protein
LNNTEGKAMRKYHFKKALLLTLTASLLSIGISGCSTVQDGLDKVKSLTSEAVSENTETAPEDAEIIADVTAPVIEAEDLTIPYGTFLHLEDAASISDDSDPSPLLEIASVSRLDQDEAAGSEEIEESAPEEPAPESADAEETASLTEASAGTEEGDPEAEAGTEEAISETENPDTDENEVGF